MLGLPKVRVQSATNILDKLQTFHESSLVIISITDRPSKFAGVNISDRMSSCTAWNRDEGGSMTQHDEAASRQRRNFLKTAGGAALALVATKDANSQNENAKPAMQPSRRRDEPADRGLWATWYDLPDSGRDGYFTWLHETYLPALLKRPGYLWAAHYATQNTEARPDLHHVEDPKVPTGFRYVLLIGAKDAGVFGNPAPMEIHAALPEQGQKMLAMRIGERVNLMIESSRCEGRAASAHKEGATGAPCIQIGSFNCPIEYEEEMLAGYVQVRLPAMCGAASCVRTRKLNSAAGWAKHAILYEFASLAGFQRDYAVTNAHAPIGLKGHSVVPMLIHAPNGPNMALRIWPPVPKA
jgi:hypothetical protein